MALDLDSNLGLNPSEAPGIAGTHEAKWEAQLARLAAYKAAHGDCSVPRGWAEDPMLGRWVKSQRELKRKLDRGEPGEGMTGEQALRLAALGFAWGPTRPLQGPNQPNEG